jgi:hypothetical protein
MTEMRSAQVVTSEQPAIFPHSYSLGWFCYTNIPKKSQSKSAANFSCFTLPVKSFDGYICLVLMWLHEVKFINYFFMDCTLCVLFKKNFHTLRPPLSFTWTLFFVILVSLLIPMPAQHQFNYCRFITSLEIEHQR